MIMLIMIMMMAIVEWCFSSPHQTTPIEPSHLFARCIKNNRIPKLSLSMCDCTCKKKTAPKRNNPINTIEFYSLFSHMTYTNREKIYCRGYDDDYQYRLWMGMGRCYYMWKLYCYGGCFKKIYLV